MRNLKGWITTTFLMIALATATTSATAGIIVGNRSVSEGTTTPCVKPIDKPDWGIIVGNVVGIIVGNLTGIIVGNVTAPEGSNCKN